MLDMLWRAVFRWRSWPRSRTKSACKTAFSSGFGVGKRLTRNEMRSAVRVRSSALYLVVICRKVPRGSEASAPVLYCPARL
jgi:hypothetical protein